LNGYNTINNDIYDSYCNKKAPKMSLLNDIAIVTPVTPVCESFNLDMNMDSVDTIIDTVPDVIIEPVTNDVLDQPTDDSMICNPFYPQYSNSDVDVISMNKRDRRLYYYRTYKHTYAICLRDHCELNKLNKTIGQSIYNHMISKSDYEQLPTYYKLVRVSPNLLNTDCHFENCMEISKDVLEPFNNNNDNIQLSNVELIIPLVDIRERTVELYNQMYEQKYNVDILLDCSILYKYYNCNNFQDQMAQLINVLCTQVKGCDYWTLKKNCDINRTQYFKDRVFAATLLTGCSGQTNKPLYDTLASVMTKLTDVKQSYPGMLSKIKTTKSKGIKGIKSVKGIKGIKNTNIKNIDDMDLKQRMKMLDMTDDRYRWKPKYYVPVAGSSDIVTKDQITNIFMCISDPKLMFTLFNTFMINKDYCHMVINNTVILDKMGIFFRDFKFLRLYNYLFSYSWMCFYLEEYALKSRNKHTDRHVFTIDTANKLPVFIYNHEMLYMNGYCTLPIAKSHYSPNFHGLCMIQKYAHYGIDTLDNFRLKLNIFLAGDSAKNIFDGVNWVNTAICGSVIPACVPKQSPLVLLVSKDTETYDTRFLKFFDEYYKNSDLDIMMYAGTMNEYIQKVYDLGNVIKANIVKCFKIDHVDAGSKPDANDANDVNDAKQDMIIEIIPDKKVCVMIYREYIERYMKEFGSFDDVKKSIDDDNIKKFLYSKYLEFKAQNANANANANLESGMAMTNANVYKLLSMIEPIESVNFVVKDNTVNIMNNLDIDSKCIYLNDLVNDNSKVPEDQNNLMIRIGESLKFKLQSKYLRVNIEVFRTIYVDHFACVSRFHLPCVRGYYDGNNVYLLPSCITAMMTFTNIDYKYFASIRDPIDILNKYRMRGFGTILNERELKYVTEYNKQSVYWKPLFVNGKHQSTLLSSALHQPNKIIHKQAIAYNSQGYNYLANHDYQQMMSSTIKNLNMMKYRAFDDSGNMKPLKRWLIDAFYNKVDKLAPIPDPARLKPKPNIVKIPGSSTPEIVEDVDVVVDDDF